MKVRNNWLTRSRYINIYMLEDGRALISHLIGRWKVLLSKDDTDALLHVFNSPVHLHVLKKIFPNESTFEFWSNSAVNSGILRYAGYDEHGAISAAYIKRPTDVSAGAPVGLYEKKWDAKGDLYCVRSDQRLIASSAVSELDLGNGEVLLSHVLGPVVHVPSLFADIFRAFRQASPPQDIWNAHAGFGRMSPAEFRQVVRLLTKKNLLWESAEAEKEAVLDYCKNFSGSEATQQLYSPQEDKWRQIFLPYKVSDERYPLIEIRVALIGPCLVQQHLEGLDVLSFGRNIDIEFLSLPTPCEKLRRFDPELVITSTVPFATGIYSCLALGEYASIDMELNRAFAAMDSHLNDIRGLTNAKILVVKLSRTGLTGNSPISPARHIEIEIIARFNQKLSQLSAIFPNVLLLDEDDVALEFPGSYWDDRINGPIHHAPDSTNSWVSLKDYRSLSLPSEGEIYCNSKPDPAFYFSSHIVDLIEVLKSRKKYRAILINPNNLLWRGDLSNYRFTLSPPTAFATVEDYFFVGLHDALFQIIRRGIKIFLIIDQKKEELERLYKNPLGLANVVDLKNIEGSFHAENPAEIISALREIYEIEPQQLVYVDINHSARLGEFFDYYNGKREDLRYFLLNHPSLRVADELRPHSDIAHVRPASEATVSVEDIDGLLLDVVSKETRQHRDRCLEIDDMRDLGVDSLGLASLVVSMEAKFGIKFQPGDFNQASIFSISYLRSRIRTLMEKPNALVSTEDQGDSRRALDLSNSIKECLSEKRDGWLFKIFSNQSKEIFKYYTRHEVKRLCEEYEASFSQAGIGLGSRVLIDAADEETCIFSIMSCIICRLSFHVFSRVIGEDDAAHLGRLTDFCHEHGFNVVITSHSKELLVSESGLIKSGVRVLLLEKDSGPRLIISSEISGNQFDSSISPEILLISSGSSGKRKIISHSYESMRSHADALSDALKISRSDLMVSWSPLHHTMGLVISLICPLVWGIPVVRVPSQLWLQSPDVVFEQLSRERGTITLMPNFALRFSAQNVNFASPADINLGHVRAVISAGEPILSDSLHDFQEKFMVYGLRPTAVLMHYGMTEVGGCISQARPQDGIFSLCVRRSSLVVGNDIEIVDQQSFNEDAQVVISCGFPLSCNSVRVESGQEKCFGELFVSAPTFNMGCSLTADKYIILDGIRYLKTGDVGFIYKGNVFVVGRGDDLLKISGILVDPGHIEYVVRKNFDARISDVIAFGIDDVYRGSQRLIVLFETADECSDSICEEISRSLATSIGITPTHVKNAYVGEIVRTASGKKSRAMTRKKYVSQLG